MFRQGSSVPINIYDGDRPVCQCQTVEDAKRIVEAVNAQGDYIELLRMSRVILDWVSKLGAVYTGDHMKRILGDLIPKVDRAVEGHK